jgi:YggT family protein
MVGFLEFIVSALLQLLTWAIIGNAILSWLIAFDVINLRHPVARQVATFLDAVTRPVLAPFRRFIPPIGGIDITPILALLVIQGVQIYLVPAIFEPLRALVGS